MKLGSGIIDSLAVDSELDSNRCIPRIKFNVDPVNFSGSGSEGFGREVRRATVSPPSKLIPVGSASLERTYHRADHGFGCKSQYSEHHRKVLALLVNRSDRLTSEEMSSSSDNLLFVDLAHGSHFPSNNVTNHRSSIPVFLGSEIMRTPSSSRLPRPLPEPCALGHTQRPIRRNTVR